MLFASTAFAEERSGAGLYMHVIEVTGVAAGQAGERQTLELDLVLHRPEALEPGLALTGLGHSANADGTLRISLSRDLTMLAPVSYQHTAASWVMDFDQRSVVKIADALAGNSEGQPGVSALVEHVHSSIPTKNYRNGFALASQVAARGEGDCTEHAVLTAAVARSFNYPARVALGMVIVATQATTAAYGHAWTEIWVDDAWQLHDATWLSNDLDEPHDIFYLPLVSLDNEGPGHASGLLDLPFRMPKALRFVTP